MPSALPPPTATEAHIWRVELGEGERRGTSSVALGAILSAYLATTAAPPLETAPDGKPRLAEAPRRLSFNLAHSGALALVVIGPGGTEVGVDVERIKPRRNLIRLAVRWLPAADAAAVAAADAAEREAIFYAAWTRHEARVKCTGAGLFGAPPGPDVRAWPVEIDAGYAAAVALEPGAPDGAEPCVTVRTWDR
jgi:4'-phosphopantetheinyl transferase